jgi:hypothetical protein
MNYKQEPYNYGNTGSQNYNIEANIIMNEDASSYDVLEAMVRLMNTATYHIDVKVLLNFVEEWAYENGQEDAFNEYFGFNKE